MRTATKTRVTAETSIELSINLDSQVESTISTGVGFLDHMLTLFAKHSRVTLNVKADGDTYVDAHHTVEDIGITLGLCLKEALADKASINRYGSAYVPMDESLGFCALDLSGRSYLVFDAELTNPKLGDFDTELVEEFFQAVAFNTEMNLHLRVLYGKNTHHKIEALFKAFGRALREAITINPEIKGVNSTKGVLYMIVIIDYDTGNTKSISKALDFIGLQNKISSDTTEIAQADGVILPGVGAYPEAMKELTRRGLNKTLKEIAAGGKPILGVCLGMQLLLESSNEHSFTNGLGLIPGHVEKLPEDPEFAVPHMGWNQLQIKRATPLTKQLDGEYVYYVHSYYANCPEEYIIATSGYSIEVPGMINKGNIYGAQFHPEKSGQIGLEILKGFKEVTYSCKSSQQ